jgi:hypothetical protein
VLNGGQHPQLRRPRRSLPAHPKPKRHYEASVLAPRHRQTFRQQRSTLVCLETRPLWSRSALLLRDGPALNTAYKLEQNHAVMPRVIVDPSLNSLISASRAVLPMHWPFVLTDDDGQSFSDYLTLSARSPTASGRIENMIRAQLEQYAGDPNILAKYQWLSETWTKVKACAAS